MSNSYLFSKKVKIVLIDDARSLALMNESKCAPASESFPVVHLRRALPWKVFDRPLRQEGSTDVSGAPVALATSVLSRLPRAALLEWAAHGGGVSA
jgi:hypothetical protein